jgi:cell division protein FtsX
VASRIDFTARELLWESRLALAVTVCALSVIAGTALWWVQMIQHASWFLDGTPSGIAASPWSTNLIVTLVVMTVGTVGALWGASRVALTYRRGSVSAR